MQPKVLLEKATGFSLAKTLLLAGIGLIGVGLAIAMGGSIFSIFWDGWLPHFVAFGFLLCFGLVFIRISSWLGMQEKADGLPVVIRSH